MIRFFLALVLISLSAMAADQKPYRVYLKPGTILTSIKTKKDVELSKGIYVNVLETSPTRRDLFIVYDKNGKPAYETTAAGLVEIEKDLQILPNVDANVTYPAPSVLKSDNKKAFFDTQFNFHLENMQTSAFNQIYSQNLASAIGTRYELRTLYTSELPVNFGLGVNYQVVTWDNNVDNSVSLNIFSFGPSFERVVYTQESLQVAVLFGGEFAPFYNATSGGNTEKYQAMLFDLGVEATWSTDFGIWSVGSHFRHHELTLKSTTRTDVSPVPEELSMNTIGAMLGYKYEWDL